MQEIILKSDLTCPACGFEETLKMPVDACLWFHECNQCHVLLTPKQGDCCVFCSYGSVPCPPIQVRNQSVMITKEKEGVCCCED